MIFCLWFVLGVLYISWAKSGEGQETKIPVSEDFNLDPDPLDIEDSIGLDQVRRMDSLHKAGKF